MSVWPMSAIVLKSGCFCLSHRIISGLISSGATTARVGCDLEFCDRLVGVDLAEGDRLVRVHLGGDRWEPIAGPPLRISTLTPVSCAGGHERAAEDFFLVSIV